MTARQIVKMAQGLLWYVFIGLAILRAANVITWSWWFIFIPLFLLIGSILLGLVATLLAELLMTPAERAFRDYHYALTGRNDWK